MFQSPASILAYPLVEQTPDEATPTLPLGYVWGPFLWYDVSRPIGDER